MDKYYETVAGLLKWKTCSNHYSISDADYNGLVIHRCMVWLGENSFNYVYYPFLPNMISYSHVWISTQRNKNKGGWKSLPKLLQYLDNKENVDAWLKKQKLIKHVLSNNGRVAKV